MRLRADDAEAPHVVDAFRWVVAGRRRPRLLAEILEPGLIEQPDLDVSRLGVQIAGDDDGVRIPELAEDRAHLILSHERPVAGVVQMRADDKEVTDPHEQRAARLVPLRRSRSV